MSFWVLSSKNLLRNPGRNAALALAIMFGYASVLLILGLITRWQNYLLYNTIYLNHVASISIYKKDGLKNYQAKPKVYNLSKQEQEKILFQLKKYSDVEFIGRYLKGSGLVSNGCKSAVFFAEGIEPKVEKTLRNHPMVRRWIPELQGYLKGSGLWNFPEVNGLGLSQGLAAKLGKTKVYEDFKGGNEPESSAPLDCKSQSAAAELNKDSTAQILASTFSGFLGISEGEIVNHFSTGFALTDDSHLVLSLKELQKLLDTDAVTYIGVYLKDQSKAHSLANVFRKDLSTTGIDLDIYDYGEDIVNPIYTGDLSFLNMLAGFTIIIMTVAIILSVLNFLTITILERTRELGTLRAVGYSPRQIAMLFLRENFLLGVFSTAGGATLAYVVKTILNRSNIRFRSPGVSGTIRLMLMPTVEQGVFLAIFVLLLVAVSTYVFSYKRASSNVQHLLSSNFE